MDEFFEETDWLCSQFFCHQEIAGDGCVLQGDRLALLPWFHQEIAGDGRVLRGDRLALLPWENRILLHFFIKKLQVMDMLFEETDWLCFAFFIRKLQVMDVLFKETGWLCQ